MGSHQRKLVNYRARNKPTTEKAIAFMAKNPTYFGSAGGVDQYEHPTLGDESPIMAIPADGRVKRTHLWEMSGIESEVSELNAPELNPDVCNSGDFCDSNMAMDAAFQSLGVDPSTYGRADEDDDMPQEVCDLWNSAWGRAKVLMQERHTL